MGIVVDILGAGRHVGKSCHIVKLGTSDRYATVILDCGLHYGKEGREKYPDFRSYFRLDPESPARDVGERLNSEIDAVVISHFHLDHTGGLPVLTERYGYRGPIYATPPTQVMTLPLLVDNVHLSNALSANKMPHDSLPEEMRHPLSEADATAAVERISPVHMGSGTVLKHLDGIGTVRLKLLPAGHVLGAAQIYLWLDENNSLLFTGDISNEATTLLPAPMIPAWKLNPTVVISESTYASHVREPKKKIDVEFLSLLEKTCNAGGKVLIPVSATGKAQELLALIAEHWSQSRLDHRVAFISGLTSQANLQVQTFMEYTSKTPLAVTCNGLFQKVSYMISRSTTEGGYKYFFDFTKYAAEFNEELLRDEKPLVLMATPANLTGGISLAALKIIAQSEKNLILIPGYCVTGTVGAQLLSRTHPITLPGDDSLVVKAACRHLSFAAHADFVALKRHVEMLDPQHLILVHGEEGGIEAFAKHMVTAFGLPTWAPRNLERVVIPSRYIPRFMNIYRDIEANTSNVCRDVDAARHISRRRRDRELLVDAAHNAKRFR